ncbi:MAG: glycosyltransferase [Candidatus Aminicenantes bacterium]|nr:glycosyltransferase [Candidatus Aminicenantes bacterium]
MKILVVCKELPHAKVIGGPVIIFNRIKYLSRNHVVSLAAFSRPEDRDRIASLEPFCRDIRLVPFPPKRSPWRAVREFFFSPVPYYFLRVHGSKAMGRAIAEMVGRDGYDFVIAEYSVMGQFLHNNPDLPPVRRVISVHECYTLARRKSFRHFRPGISKLREALYLKGLQAYEFEMYRRADKVLTLTPQGRDELLAVAPDLDISVVPHGVDVETFAFSPETGEDAGLVFIGNYRHYPNVDAVLFFHEQIWPRIRAARPGLTFTIVGQDPPPEVARLGEDGSVIVTGTVDDVVPYLRRGKVFLCPVRLGGGFRGKILEAMAVGRPVVSTSLGAEGIPARHGENILLADAPEDFAAGVLRLLGDEDLYRKIQGNGRKLMEDIYAWDKGVAVLEKILEDMMSRPPSHSAEGRER